VAIYHMVGLTRPVGGSGQLAAALVRCLEHHGGVVRLGAEAEVRAILLERGRAAGVELASGERVTARAVISNAQVKTTLLRLLPPDALAAELRERIAAIRTGNGIGMTIRCAVDALPAYTAAPPADGANPHAGMQLICPSVAYLQAAYADMTQGQPARQPALVVMTPSALDATITPPGKHGLYIWAQYHPYALAGGGPARWDVIREQEAARLLETLAAYAPNVRDSVRGTYIQSPLDLERNVGLLGGNIMHLDMSLDQMFMLRPLPELAGYRTPVPGLYLTGASTHPGGGVAGASGRNAAGVILADGDRR
jgi:phytoene dehydrogenase-like protein